MNEGGSTDLKSLDIVIPVKKNGDNEELRYCLRSIEKNFPHRKIFIVGYAPDWITNVEIITPPPSPSIGTFKYHKTGLNIRVACANDDITPDFVLFNDDFFVIRRMDSAPYHHKGDIQGMIDLYSSISSEYKNYVAGMVLSREILEEYGFEDVKSFEMHEPMIFNRKRWLNISRLQRRVNIHGLPVHMKTLYCNFYAVEAEPAGDVKVYDDSKLNIWDSVKVRSISTSDGAFKHGEVGRFIRSAFPGKSRFEND